MAARLNLPRGGASYAQPVSVVSAISAEPQAKWHCPGAQGLL